MTRKTRRAVSRVRVPVASAALAVARGVAMFVGIYLLGNAVATVLGARMTQDVWLIDTNFLPAPAAMLLRVGSALLLISYALAPRSSRPQSLLTVLACVALAAIALHNAVDFYRAWIGGAFDPHVLVPFSVAVVVAFGLLGWAVWWVPAPKTGAAPHVAALVTFILVAAAFPVAQMGFFGTSDYRAKADAAVVFGARANRGGSLSTSLADRVNTAVDLYRSGLVRKLIMSGGVSDSRVDEPQAMRAAAMRAGVPASAILLDDHGIDTNATVADTAALFRRDGIRRVLAVSQGYHLPRVKLAYLTAGLNVRTVPAGTSIPIPQTPLYMLREVPAFWEYWVQSVMRG